MHGVPIGSLIGDDEVEKKSARPGPKPRSRGAGRDINEMPIPTKCMYGDGSCRHMLAGTREELTFHWKDAHGVDCNSKEKIRCPWQGCTSAAKVQGDSLSRHVSYIHLRVGKMCDNWLLGCHYVGRSDAVKRHLNTCDYGDGEDTPTGVDRTPKKNRHQLVSPRDVPRENNAGDDTEKPKKAGKSGKKGGRATKKGRSTSDDQLQYGGVPPFDIEGSFIPQ